MHGTLPQMRASSWLLYPSLPGANGANMADRIGFGIGTPARIIDLVNTGTYKQLSKHSWEGDLHILTFSHIISNPGSLKLDHLEQIVIDGSYVDQKKRGIFDMKEIYAPLLDFLLRPDLRARYTSSPTDNTAGRVEIVVF